MGTGSRFRNRSMIMYCMSGPPHRWRAGRCHVRGSTRRRPGSSHRPHRRHPLPGRRGAAYAARGPAGGVVQPGRGRRGVRTSWPRGVTTGWLRHRTNPAHGGRIGPGVIRRVGVLGPMFGRGNAGWSSRAEPCRTILRCLHPGPLPSHARQSDRLRIGLGAMCRANRACRSPEQGQGIVGS